MNIKKAIVSAVVFYALVFLFASMMIVSITDTTLFGSIMVIAVAVLAFLIAKYYYFKESKISNPIKDGLQLGIVMAIIAFAIEVPVMVYGFAAEHGWSYLMSWNIVLGYILMLVIPILAASHAKK